VVIPLPMVRMLCDKAIRRLTCVCTKCNARVSETERVWARESMLTRTSSSRGGVLGNLGSPGLRYSPAL